MLLLAEAQERTEALLVRDETWEGVWEMASIHAARGDLDEAIRWAEQAYESAGYRFPWFIEIDPMFDSVRDDPRFKAILTKMSADVGETRLRIEREEIVARIR